MLELNPRFRELLLELWLRTQPWLGDDASNVRCPHPERGSICRDSSL